MRVAGVPPVEQNEWDRMPVQEGLQKWLDSLGNRRSIGEHILHLRDTRSVPVHVILRYTEEAQAYLTMEEQRNLLRVVREYGTMCRIEGDGYYLTDSELQKYNAGNFEVMTEVMYYNHVPSDPLGRL